MSLFKRQPRPPFGPPGGQPPMMPPGGGPPSGGGSGGAPPGRPPIFIPQESQGIPLNLGSTGGGPGGPSVKAVDPGAIFPCMYRYTYIWPNRGRGFWAYVTFVGRNSLAGWRFINGRWQYFGMDLRRIRSFYCF